MIITKDNFLVKRWGDRKESLWNTCLILKPVNNGDMTEKLQQQQGKRGEKKSLQGMEHISCSSYLRWQKSVLSPLDWIRAPDYYKKGIPGKKEWVSLD